MCYVDTPRLPPMSFPYNFGPERSSLHQISSVRTRIALGTNYIRIYCTIRRNTFYLAHLVA
jgi:hypothetical protein